MTHDWFSHTREGQNHPTERIRPDDGGNPSLGCDLPPEEAAKIGCRPGDWMERALAHKTSEPKEIKSASTKKKKTENKEEEPLPELEHSYKTYENFVTAWWDASQIYGYDETSQRRVVRDPNDPAKLLLKSSGLGKGTPGKELFLPAFQKRCEDGETGADCSPIHENWAGQESVAFPDNWSVGLSFFHNLFAREHNKFVAEFRAHAKRQPDADSGLRDPAEPAKEILNKDFLNMDTPPGGCGAQQKRSGACLLFEVARLVISAEIAKIHTIEWTTQLLYNEPLFVAMNSNWSGLFEKGSIGNLVASRAVKAFSKSGNKTVRNELYSAIAAGSGIVGTGAEIYWPPEWLTRQLGIRTWDLSKPQHVNGGTNHFGSPFNFPEEFVSVYRLHPLLPDMLEYRELDKAKAIARRVPIIDTFRHKATAAMHEGGLKNWALTMGRQHLGKLTLQNHPRFLQNLNLARGKGTKRVDIAALDIIRDRERGVPRFNAFRRQIGLKALTTFDDFIDKRLEAASDGETDELKHQYKLVCKIREIYGTRQIGPNETPQPDRRSCQKDENGKDLNYDPNVIDNIEDVDLLVGWLAEFTRPHGFAISETQFQIFIINASRRLFSDRFFTSSYRPEFYSHFGLDWVENNGPCGKHWEWGLHNGQKIEISPLKRVLLRVMPELAAELSGVANAFDPWGRDRGEFYALGLGTRKPAKARRLPCTPL